MSEAIEKTRKRYIATMQKTCATLGHILKHVTQEQATTLRDGADGWTVLEVVGHLRDFDGFFYDRAVMMLEQGYPLLPKYNHEALAVERNYNGEDLKQVYNQLAEARGRFVEFFQSLTLEQWERGGIHPERGPFSLSDAALQVCFHDADHLEQITRILTQS